MKNCAPDPFFLCWTKPTWKGGVVLLPLKMRIRLIIFSPLDEGFYNGVATYLIIGINKKTNCERPQKLSLKKEIWMLLRESLFLGKWCGVATYFFIQKIRKNKYKYMTKLFPFIDWIKKNTYLKIWKITWLWVLVANYQIIHGFLS